MYTINISKKKYDELMPLEVDKKVLNTEAKMYMFNYKGKDKVFKNLYKLNGRIFGNKLYTLEMLSDNKDILPSNFVLPESLCTVNGNIAGFIEEYIQGINLQVILNDPKVDLNTKLYYLTCVGNILEQLKHIREESEIEGIYLNDLHPGNFIVTPSKELKVIDLDSCKIGGNNPFPSRFLTSGGALFNYSKKYKRFEKYGTPDYISEYGYIEADENSDLYCYNISILNFLYGKNMDNMSMDRFYNYLRYLKEIGFSAKLIKCFEKIVSNAQNDNPRNLLSELNDRYDLVAKANYKVYEFKNK